MNSAILQLNNRTGILHIYMCVAILFMCGLFFLGFAHNAEAAIAAGGSTCTTNSLTSGTTMQCTLATQNLEAGNVAVMIFASDNIDTTDTTNNLLSSVSDSGGNTWTVQKCFTNGQGAQNSGATACIATSNITTTLTSGVSTITATLSNARSSKAMSVREFTVGAGNGLSVAGTIQTLANDATDPGSMTVSGLSSAQYLFVRSTALERFSGTWTATTNFTSIACAIANSGSLNGPSMSSCGEYRIVTTVSQASNPTGSNVDNASVYLALQETSLFSLSGTLYADEGTTAITTARTIKVAIGTTTPASVISDTTDGSGAWSVSPSTTGIATGTPVIAWVEGDSTYPAAVVTRLNNANSVTGLNLYAGEVIARSEDGSALTVGDMATYDGTIDPSVPYITDADTGLLRIKEGIKFAVANGSSFAGATTTIFGGGVRNDGTLDTSSGTTYFETNSTVSGSSSPLFGPTYIGTATSTFINDGAIWTAHSAAAANTWADVTYGEGLFVATACGISSVSTCNSTAGGNRIMTSPDGITWTGRTASEANEWRKIAYGEGRFVTVAPSGTHQVMYSDDGINWNNATAASADQWAAIAYGEGKFTAMSYDGTAMYSDDGIAWSLGTGSDTVAVYDITYSEEDGQFVAVGANYIGTSPDGITWTSRTSPEDNWWGDVVYGKGLYVAVAAINAGPHSVMTSPDGITWTVRNTPENATLIGIAFTGALFVAVGYADLGNQVVTSPDGVNWTGREEAETNAWEAVIYANNTLVAVGSNGTNRVMTSDSGFDYAATNFENSGSTWTARSAPAAYSWRATAFGKGRFVSVSTDGTTDDGVMYSDDNGATWHSASSSEASGWRALTYGNGLFVATAHSGTNRVMTSPDGIVWTSHSASEANQWRSVTYGNGLFVALADNGTNRVMTSPDGVTWTARSAAQANGWSSIAYGNGIFVGVSYDGTNEVMTSPDGITWTARTAANNNAWRSVTYGNGIFVAIADSGTDRVMTSPDGITWTAQSAAENNSWYAVKYGGGIFVAVAVDGTNRVMTSPDGVNWTARAATEANSWFSLAYGNDTFVGTAFDGTNRVMTSSNGSYADTLTTFASHASTTDLTISASSTLDIQNGLTIYGDFTNNGAFAAADDSTTYVDVFDGTVGYDLANGSYDSVSLAVTETNAWGMDFSTDGTKLYVLGYDTDLVREFTLSTAWDISSASQTHTNSVAGISSFPNSVAISTDGTKIYFTSDDDDTVYQFALSPAYDVSSASQTTSFDFSAKETSPRGLTFSTDGTKMYVSGESSDSVHQYTLSSAWDVSSATFVQSFSFTTQDTDPQGIDFSSDGTKLYMSGLTNDRVYEYELSSAWDISTAVYSEFFEMGNEGFNNEQVDISDDGTKMYVLSIDNDRVYSYTIGTAGSGTPDTDKVFAGNMTGENAFSTFTISAEDSTITFDDDVTTGDLTIGATATVTAPTSMTIDGDFINNGGFAESGGSLFFSGASPTVSGVLTGTSALGNVTASSTTYTNDGITWTGRSAASADQWSSVAYGDGTFVAVSWDGTVMSSTDGITWTSRTGISGSPSWQDVTYGEGIFVAVSSQGTDQVMTSPDGITWTSRTAAEANSWKTITYGGGQFVAVACGIGTGGCDTTAGGHRVMTSTDGITWTSRTAVEANSWQSVTYGGGLFAAVSYDGTNRVMTSPDGITWTSRSAAAATDWNAITYGDGLFVAVATNGVMTSPDGETWTSRSAAEANSWFSVTYGGGIFVAVAEGGTNRVMTSPDGITWTARTAGAASWWYGVTYGENTFVAVSVTGTNRVMTSDTGSYDGVLTFSSTASTTDLTVGAGNTLLAPPILSIADDYTNSGTFIHNDGTVYFNGATAQAFSGNLTATSSFNDVVFSGAGTKTFSDNASTSALTIVSGATVVAPDVLSISGDYTNSGTFTSGSGTLYVEGTTTASTTAIASWDITTATYDGSAFSVTAQETQVTSLAFSPDGTRMFIDGYGGDAVKSYTLSSAWDVTTASYDSKSFSTASQDAFVEKIAFNDDGTKMYTLGSGNDTVYQYSLSSAWDVTTASYGSVSKSVTAQDTAPFGMTFTSDGSRMFIAGNTNDRIYSYTLSTPWLISSASYDSKSFLISSQEASVQDVAFNDDGTQMYTIGYTADTINQYTLSSAWDVTTASFTGSKSITAQETTPDGLEFKSDGSKVYVHGETASDIFPYSLDYLETTTYLGTTTLSGTMTGTSAFNDLSLSTSDTFVPDGVTWTARNESEDSTWSAITYGNGTFVALAYSGTNRVMTSPDGITWTSHSASQANSWNSITYGEGLFVAVAGNGTNQVMTSPDGITWTNRTAAAANEWYSVTYGAGQFVAIAHNDITGSVTCSSNCVMTSPDGITWTSRTAAAANKWERIVYGEGLFVASASTGTDLVMTSPDGITWTSRNVPGSAWYGLAYGNGTFVAVAYDWVITSPDGITWTTILTSYEANGWQSVTYGGGMFVAVSPDGTNQIMTSTDNGANWTPHAATNANKWWDVVYGENTFVAVAQQTSAGATCTTNCVMTSASGDTYVGEIVFANNASTTDFTITTDSNITAPSRLSIAGDYSNDGSIEYGTGTTTFDGTTAQTATGTLSGTSAFYNVELLNSTATTSFETALTIDGRLTATSSAIIEFPAGATTTVASFNVVGTSGSEVVLRSTQDGTQWGLDATAHSVSFVDAKDSNACSGNGNITAADSYDRGNNDCWDITAPAGAAGTISSAANQIFGYGQATTSISAITITDANTPTITAANDLRITIDTTKTDMLWDTTDTSAVFGGTASGKVGNPVSYEDGGATLVVPVSTNFSGEDMLTISGLSYAQFGTLNTATSSLSLNVGGAAVPGETWTARSAAEANSWSSLTYGEGLFVAVANDGTNRVMTSPDGITWTARSAAETNIWQSVTYGGGVFVAVSSDGTNRVMTSPDGITWTARSAPSKVWIDVTYGNGLFVAVESFNEFQGDTGDEVMTSPDGINWTLHSSQTAQYWFGIAYGNGLFVTVGRNGAVQTSPDGTTWTSRTGVSSHWVGIVYDNSLFVAVANGGTNRVMTSPDGITWTARSAAEANSWKSVTYGGGVFVAVSYDGTNRVMTSPDGITWTARSAAEANSWQSVTYGGGVFVAVSSDGTNRVMTSESSATSAANDDKTIAIHGAANLADHTAGQVTNVFSYQNQSDEPLFAFNLAPVGENATVTSAVFTLSGIRRIDSSNLADLRLYRDNNSDGAVDGADTQIGGAGVLAISGQSGTITFSTSWSATTTKNYILTADISGVLTNEYMTISLQTSGVVGTGATTGGAIVPLGSVTSVQHIRGGNNGGGVGQAEIGGSAPEGDGDVGGGGSGGGGGVGEEDNGQQIGNETGFIAPTATGEIYSEWTGGSNALSSDGAWATAASANLRQSYSVFGFNVPTGNRIDGIEVKLEASGSTGAGTIQVALSWNGDSSVTATKATSVLTSSDGVYTLGGPSDTWGHSWTPAEFGDANFFVRVIAQPDQNTVKVDAIQVKPYHATTGGGGSGGGEI